MSVTKPAASAIGPRGTSNILVGRTNININMIGKLRIETATFWITS